VCTQQACLKCCTDLDCEGHREQREKEREKESIINATHPIQIQAQKLRLSAVKPGLFHESAFRYLGETLLIWDVRQYSENPKLRDEAMRKSRRYVESPIYTSIHPPNRKGKRKQFGMDKDSFGRDESKCITLGIGRRKRFKHVMNFLYQESLK